MTKYHILHQLRLQMQIQEAVVGMVPGYLVTDEKPFSKSVKCRGAE